MRQLIGIACLLALGCGGSTDDSTGGAGSGGSNAGGAGGATGGSGGTAIGGAGGASGGSGGTATGGAGGATGGSGGTSAGGSGGCGPQGCGLFTCCGDKCVNPDNDIKNCGKCGTVCPGTFPFCEMGTCKATPPCTGTACIGTKFCCGTTCCDPNQLCCDVPESVSMGLTCNTPVDGTCPKGCKGCACNSPDTPIATPTGERAVSELRVGDLVFSLHRGVPTAVPVARVASVPAPGHTVIEVVLATGQKLEISAAHPAADGSTFAELRAGALLDGVRVVSARSVPYRHTHTFDILPDSDSGTYYAGGVLIGSTLVGPRATRPSSGDWAAPSSR